MLFTETHESRWRGRFNETFCKCFTKFSLFLWFKPVKYFKLFNFNGFHWKFVLIFFRCNRYVTRWRIQSTGCHLRAATLRLPADRYGAPLRLWGAARPGHWGESRGAKIWIFEWDVMDPLIFSKLGSCGQVGGVVSSLNVWTWNNSNEKILWMKFLGGVWIFNSVTSSGLLPPVTWTTTRDPDRKRFFPRKDTKFSMNATINSYRNLLNFPDFAYLITRKGFWMETVEMSQPTNRGGCLSWSWGWENVNVNTGFKWHK